MQALFNRDLQIGVGTRQYANWDYVKATLSKNIGFIKAHYSSRVYSVKSNHILCRIINSINIPLNSHYERVYDLTSYRAMNFSMGVGLSSSIYRGKLFDGEFYGSNTKEFLVSVTEYEDPKYMYQNWKTIDSVKVLRHPRSDLELMLPNGKDTSYEGGVAVLTIDIPKLILQYKAFADEVFRLNLESVPPIGAFVHGYVLPNMMSSHLDYCLFNRVNNVLVGAPMGVSLKSNTFMTANIERTATNVHLTTVSNLKNRLMDFQTTLKSIPAVAQSNMFDVMGLPAMAPTRQYRWLETLTRINTVLFLAKLTKTRALSLIGDDVNRLKIIFRSIRNDRGLSTYIPGGLYSELIDGITEVERELDM